MSLAKEVNEKLDAILRHQQERKAVEKDYQDPEFSLNDSKTGKLVTKEMVLNKADEIYADIIDDLNKLTNEGQNCRNLFANEYYVNDMSQDRIVAEEMRANKLKLEELKQKGKMN